MQIDLAVPKGIELCGDQGGRWKPFRLSVDRQRDLWGHGYRGGNRGFPFSLLSLAIDILCFFFSFFFGGVIVLTYLCMCVCGQTP